MVVNLIADVDTFLAALDRMFPSGPGGPGGGGGWSRPFPVPFGPTRARSQSFDGDFVSPQDLVLAALAGQIRVLLTGDDGQVIKMTRRSRFFTGPLRDAALATATRCGHAGCLVATSCLQVDHWLADSHGGLTEIANSGGGACRHHNNWRYTSAAKLQRHPDGRLTTHRPDDRHRTTRRLRRRPPTGGLSACGPSVAEEWTWTTRALARTRADPARVVPARADTGFCWRRSWAKTVAYCAAEDSSGDGDAVGPGTVATCGG
jgi:hypothetical protein